MQSCDCVHPPVNVLDNVLEIEAKRSPTTAGAVSRCVFPDHIQSILLVGNDNSGGDSLELDFDGHSGLSPPMTSTGEIVTSPCSFRRSLIRQIQGD